MMGQIPNCGMGETEIMIDESKLIDIYAEEETELDDLDNGYQMIIVLKM